MSKLDPNSASLADWPTDIGFVRASLPPMGAPSSGRRWVLRDIDEAGAAAIEAETECGGVLARILAGRGVRAGAASRHLNPSLRDALPDPSRLMDADIAAARLADAVVNDEKCGVFGDYDVDGTCGAAILKLYFDAIGAPLDVYLPDRILEGYGPTIEAFRTLSGRGAKVIITVDCGAAAHAAVDAAAAEGVAVVVLDHHQMDGPPPRGAVATINPNRPDDRSGLTDLSATGVVFMAIVALNRALRARGRFKGRAEPDLMRFLDIVALGLVCDVMPMTGLARVITAQGLKVLAAGGNEGLRLLGARAGMKAKPTAYDLGFVLGPRINAAGRIGHARLAFELLTTNDAARRTMLVERLHVMNAERQEIERSVQDAAIALIEAGRAVRDPVIVVAGESWHPGVIGIVAGRLKDRYERPAIVIALDGGAGKGSARSLSGVDIGAAFRAAREAGLLIAGGGHAMAAGLTIEAGKIGAFTDFLTARLGGDVDAAIADARREIDAVVAPSAVSAPFAEAIEAAGPYGPGNPEPVFALCSLHPRSVRPVGVNHLSVLFASDTGEDIRAIAFRAAGEPLGELLASGRRLHVAGKIKADDWRGGSAGQLQIVDAAEAL